MTKSVSLKYNTSSTNYFCKDVDLATTLVTGLLVAMVELARDMEGTEEREMMGSLDRSRSLRLIVPTEEVTGIRTEVRPESFLIREANVLMG